MFTLGYSFRPWVEGKAIADGHSILNYINETAKHYGVDKNIRLHHLVKRASVVVTRMRRVDGLKPNAGRT